MLKKFQKSLTVGLSGLLALGISIADASDTTNKRQANVLHEMVPHVVLPETIQYNKTVRNNIGSGYTGVTSPYVGSYTAYPSYQVPYSVSFRQVGQAIYPVSPPLLPTPLTKDAPEQKEDSAVNEAELTLRELAGKDVVLSTKKITEPIQLASSAEKTIPALPMPNQPTQSGDSEVTSIMQTGIFCQRPAEPPSAWAFSSPIFKIASVPTGWGGQTGMINQQGLKNCSQQVGFYPSGQGMMDPAGVGTAVQQGVPYSTFQMGRHGGTAQAQTQILPNGMILLTLPQIHDGCGIFRCRSAQPKFMLLPPTGVMPSPMMQTPAQTSMIPAPMMPNSMMASSMMGGMGSPFMQVSQQQPMQSMPVMTMTPIGPAVIGYQQMPMMNQSMMNPALMNPMMPSLQSPLQMSMATPNPAVTSQVSGESGSESLQTPNPIGSEAGTTPTTAAANSMSLVATPFGYMLQVPSDAMQTDAAAQQMQQSLVQSQMQQMPMAFSMPSNPYAGLYATPFGYLAMNQSAGQLGSPMMMNVGQSGIGSMGMGMGMYGGQGGMGTADLLQLMNFINSYKPQRRGLFARIAERREMRRASGEGDLISQLMQSWSTPYVDPSMSLRMPAQNAYPYGYFGAQSMPISTANYGGSNNLYMGSTTYPGMY